MPEDLNAWEIIIRREDTPLIFLTLIINTIVNAMWDTEDKAIIFFKSTTNMHVSPTSVSLNIDTTINILKMEYVDIVGLNRRIPKPPNLSSTPASTMEP